MRIALKALKMIGIILLILILLIGLLIIRIITSPMVPKDYTKTVETGGALEAKYLAAGAHKVKYTEAEAPEDWKKFEAYYPEELEKHKGTYPVVVFVNGTGVYGSKYKALFRHLASWGFIVLGNEDPSTCAGTSADATLAWLLEEDENPDSVFYQRVNRAHVGISGHSQGGVGVFNAVNAQPHGHMYTCAVSLSPTEWALAAALGMDYDPYQTKIPTMVLAAAENDVITPEGTQSLFEAIGSNKVAALRAGMGHGEMLYSGDGYVTAWFMWQLQGDQEAAGAFTGQHPELLRNPLYQDVRMEINS